jgi:hypothetical protein
MLKRRRIKWLGFSVLAIAVLGSPLAFGISNLLLMSPWGRSLVAARIQRSIRLDHSVQGFPGRVFYQANPAAKPVLLR